MKHRLTTFLALAVLAGAALSATAAGAAHGRLYAFRGQVLAAGSGSLQLQVEGGNHAALRAMLGAGQNQAFTVGSSTEVLVWSNGVPHVGSLGDVQTGSWAQVDVRAADGSSLSQIESTAASVVSVRSSEPSPPSQPLYLYVGTVAGGQAGGHIALHVTSGNWRGLQTMLGASLDQTFTYDGNTIFLLWQGKEPTVIDPSQLKAGDRITIRVRAARDATLAQVESTPAVHVGDHEPGNPQSESS